MTNTNIKAKQEMMAAIAVIESDEKSFSVSCERGEWKNAHGETQRDCWTTCFFNGKKLYLPVSFFEEASALSRAEYARWQEHVAIQQKTNKTQRGFRPTRDGFPSTWQKHKGNLRVLCLATYNELLRKSGIRIAAKTKKGNSHCSGLSVTAAPNPPRNAPSFDDFEAHAGCK